jgi:hypothetical protein
VGSIALCLDADSGNIKSLWRGFVENEKAGCRSYISHRVVYTCECADTADAEGRSMLAVRHR